VQWTQNEVKMPLDFSISSDKISCPGAILSFDVVCVDSYPKENYIGLIFFF